MLRTLSSKPFCPPARSRLHPASGFVQLDLRLDELEYSRDVSAFEGLIAAVNEVEVVHSLGRWAR
jgi:hypothetical protein